MNKHRTFSKAYIENILRHVIFKVTTTIDNIQEAKINLNDSKAPLWIEEPIKNTMNNIIKDLMEALEPATLIAKREYVSRPDRLEIIQEIERKIALKKNEQSGYSPCRCCGCEDNRKIDEVISHYQRNKDPNNPNERRGRPRKSA